MTKTRTYAQERRHYRRQIETARKHLATANRSFSEWAALWCDLPGADRWLAEDRIECSRILIRHYARSIRHAETMLTLCPVRKRRAAA